MDYRLSPRIKPTPPPPPKPSAPSNAPDPRLEVGTEHVLRYLANVHNAITQTKRLCSEDRLHNNRLEVDPDVMIPFPLYQDIGHQPIPPPNFHMYVGPLVPTDPLLLVMHKIDAVIFWVMNIHNQLFDIQSLRTLRTLNIPHQNSRHDNIRALNTFYNNASDQLRIARNAILHILKPALVSLNWIRIPSPYIIPLKIISTRASGTRAQSSPIHSLNVNTRSIPNNLLLASRSRKCTTTLPPTVSPYPLPPSPPKSSICLPRNGNYANPLIWSTHNTPP